MGVWPGPRTNVFMFTLRNEPNHVSIIYVHELAHIFGVDDHYCEHVFDRDGNFLHCIGRTHCSNIYCSPGLPRRNPRPGFCIMNAMYNHNHPNMAIWNDDVNDVRDVHDIFCIYCIRDIINFLQENDFLRVED